MGFYRTSHLILWSRYISRLLDYQTRAVKLTVIIYASNQLLSIANFNFGKRFTFSTSLKPQSIIKRKKLKCIKIKKHALLSRGDKKNNEHLLVVFKNLECKHPHITHMYTYDFPISNLRNIIII